MVIGAFVLARLLGLRLLTLEAQVVVHDGDGDVAGSGPLVMTRLAPDRPAPSPARPQRPVPPTSGAPPGAPGPRDRRLRPERPLPADRYDRPDPSGSPGLASGGSDPLALAVQLVEQGADTLERTRRGQYRG